MILAECYMQLSKKYQANIREGRLHNLDELDALLNSYKKEEYMKGFQQLIEPDDSNLCRILRINEEHDRLDIAPKYAGCFINALIEYLHQAPSWKKFWEHNHITHLFLRAYQDLDFDAAKEWQRNTMDQLAAEMCLVPSGDFLMGALKDDKDAHKMEQPQHRVVLSRDYWVGKYPVTQYLVRKITGDCWWGYIRGFTRPTDSLTWFEAIKFCNTYSRHLGREEAYTIKGREVECNWESNGVRLLTEAEWERAARGGVSYHKFAGSNFPEEVAWYDKNSGYAPAPVGCLAPNDYGLHDMCGNIAEWCWDWVGRYPSENQLDPKGPLEGKKKVCRGGSAYMGVEYNRTSKRWFNSKPNWSNNDLGFRIAWNAD